MAISGLAITFPFMNLTAAYEQAVSEAGIEIVGKSKWNNTLLVRIHKEKELRKLDDLDFITRKMKVFSAPDSVSQRVRSSVRRGLNDWT
jgi:serine protease AprX